MPFQCALHCCAVLCCLCVYEYNILNGFACVCIRRAKFNMPFLEFIVLLFSASGCQCVNFGAVRVIQSHRRWECGKWDGIATLSENSQNQNFTQLLVRMIFQFIFICMTRDFSTLVIFCYKSYFTMYNCCVCVFA